MAKNVVVPPFDVAPETVVGSTPQSVFPFNFPFWSAGDIIVLVDGQPLAGGFTVQGYFIQNGQPVEGGYGSGEVTLNAPVSNCTVTIDRFVKDERRSQFSRAAPLGIPPLNADLNKATARDQDLKRASRTAGATAESALALAKELSAASILPRVTVENLAALKALLPGVPSTVRMVSRSVRGDGGAGDFEWIEGDQSANVSADPMQGVWVAPDGQSGSLGAWRRTLNGPVTPEMFGARRGRDYAFLTTNAINAMLDFCGLAHVPFDLGMGSWFVNDTIRILRPVSGGGRGVGYWHTYAAAFNNGKNQPARTQIILTGDGPKTFSPTGMSSMRSSGGVVQNPSARAGWNEAEYSLTNLNRPLSIGIYIDPAAEGSSLYGFRVLPDGGGDDGLLLYNDETATASTDWADDWDVGIWADSCRKITVRDVQSVGHFRITGKISTSIPIDHTIQPPPAPYEQYWVNCDFGGWRATMVRGSDTYQITGIGSDYVEVDYPEGHSFNPSEDPYFALSKNSFFHTSATFAGLETSPGTLRLTGVAPNPSTDFAVGDTIVARRFGGGTSQMHHTNCRIHGMIHPSGLQCHDTSLGDRAMPHPGTAVEVSGNRVTEVIFDQSCSIQTGEQVIYHVHEAVEVQLTDIIEFNLDIERATPGARVILSPSISTNSRVPHPSGSSIRVTIGGGANSGLLNNNGPSGSIDIRPMVNIPLAAYALFSSDNGLMTGDGTRLPSLAVQQDDKFTGIRTPHSGVSGVYDDSYPSARPRLVYDAVSGRLVAYVHLFPNSGGSIDLGNTISRYRAIYVSNPRFYPSPLVNPLVIGELTIDAPNDATIRFRRMGLDGVVRSASITLT